MQCNQLLNEEKRKILSLVKHEFVSLDFSSLTMILDNNYNIPCWMDVYILIYKSKLPEDIKIYDIILKKLSQPILRFYFKSETGKYISNADEFMIKRYVRYLITGDKIKYNTKTQYIPNKEYIKEILKYKKFENCGLYLKHINRDEFIIYPIEYKITNTEEAKETYENIFDAYDLYKSLKLNKENLLENFKNAIILSKDKRMIATLSTILAYINCKFEIQDNYITIGKTNIKIVDEDSAKKFESDLHDAYQFFRNVINFKDKKDIVSEIYNKKISPDIMEQFEDNVTDYLKIIENKELIDWIITISRESKYTLKITFDEQGIFYIDGNIIITPQEAKDFYIEYMNTKKEKTAMMVYRANIISKVKHIWSTFIAKFKK